MNDKKIKRIAWILGCVAFLLCLFAAYQAGTSQWERMTTEEKPLRQAFIVQSDGSRMFGAYCSEEGTVLDGGIICHIEEFSRSYTHTEMVQDSLGVGIFVFVLCVVACLVLAVLVFTFLLKPREKSRTTAAK